MTLYPAIESPTGQDAIFTSLVQTSAINMVYAEKSPVVFSTTFAPAPVVGKDFISDSLLASLVVCLVFIGVLTPPLTHVFGSGYHGYQYPNYWIQVQ